MPQPETVNDKRIRAQQTRFTLTDTPASMANPHFFVLGLRRAIRPGQGQSCSGRAYNLTENRPVDNFSEGVRVSGSPVDSFLGLYIGQTINEMAHQASGQRSYPATGPWGKHPRIAKTAA